MISPFKFKKANLWVWPFFILFSFYSVIGWGSDLFTTFEEAESYLRDNYIPKGSDWYSSYTKLPLVEHIYYSMAQQMGGVAIVGGSDLADIILGGGVKTSSLEVNVLSPVYAQMDKNLKNLDAYYPLNFKEVDYNLMEGIGSFGGNRDSKKLSGAAAEKLKRQNFVKQHIPNSYPQWITNNTSGALNVYLDIPANPLPEGKFIINFGEVEKEYQIYGDNFSKGVSVADGTLYLWSALKYRYLLFIHQNGEVRLYFRDELAKADYENKTMRLPDEYLLKGDPIRKGINAIYVWNQLFYNIALIAKGLDTGWKMSPMSLEILRSWSKRISSYSDFVESDSYDYSDFLAKLATQVRKESLLEALSLVGYVHPRPFEENLNVFERYIKVIDFRRLQLKVDQENTNLICSRLFKIGS